MMLDPVGGGCHAFTSTPSTLAVTSRPFGPNATKCREGFCKIKVKILLNLQVLSAQGWHPSQCKGRRGKEDHSYLVQNTWDLNL